MPASRLPDSVAALNPEDPAGLYIRRLTRREMRVAGLVAEGYDTRAISRRLHIRQAHVRILVYHLLHKLDLVNRYQLIRYWVCPLFHEGLRALGMLPIVSVTFSSASRTACRKRK